MHVSSLSCVNGTLTAIETGTERRYERDIECERDNHMPVCVPKHNTWSTFRRNRICKVWINCHSSFKTSLNGLMSFISWNWDIISHGYDLHCPWNLGKWWFASIFTRFAITELNFFVHHLTWYNSALTILHGPKSVRLVIQFSFWNITLSNLQLFCPCMWFQYLTEKENSSKHKPGKNQ